MTAYELIYETIGKEITDEKGNGYRVDDIRATRIGDRYDYMIGLQPLGHLTRRPMIYVTLDRFDTMGLPNTWTEDTPMADMYGG